VILSIRHKGLKRLYESDDPRGVIREHAQKLHDILARLDASISALDMDLPVLSCIRLRAIYKAFGQ
jgi:proteic killer suppression protein